MKTLTRQRILAVAGFVYLLVVWFNVGFLATDEYWDGITRYIPAQKATVATLIKTDDVKSPLQILPMHAAAQLAYKLGIESPFDQYHFVIFFWGLVSFGLCAWAAILLFRSKSENLVKLALLALAFHFATPGLITRPMFEALAAPWVALSCAFAVMYDEKNNWRRLLAGVFCASMAFVLRQQTGFGALVFLILPLMHKRWMHFLIACFSGLIFFILAGIPDIYLRGRFHHSLRALAEYNFKYGAHYGDQPWHFFLPLIFICMMIPWLIAKYPPGFLKDYFKRYRSMYMILGFFLVLHSMFANKFERFLISMIPLMVFLMVPLLAYFFQEWPKRKARILSLLAVNFILWLPASFFPAQKNVIDLARYMDAHPEYKTIINVNSSYDWIPDTFMRQPFYNTSYVENKVLQTLKPDGCDYILVANENAYNQNEALLNDRYRLLEKFDVNIIEAISYKLNPEHNVRRSPLRVFGCKR
jgi:hypothetical protein